MWQTSRPRAKLTSVAVFEVAGDAQLDIPALDDLSIVHLRSSMFTVCHLFGCALVVAHVVPLRGERQLGCAQVGHLR